MSESMNETMNEVESIPAPPIETAAEPVNENVLFAQTPPVQKPHYKSPMYIPSLVLGILSIVFSLLIALVGDILGVIGISLAVSRRWEYNVTAGLICSIVGLALSIINHILAVVLMMSM